MVTRGNVRLRTSKACGDGGDGGDNRSGAGTYLVEPPPYRDGPRLNTSAARAADSYRAVAIGGVEGLADGGGVVVDTVDEAVLRVDRSTSMTGLTTPAEPVLTRTRHHRGYGVKRHAGPAALPKPARSAAPTPSKRPTQQDRRC